MVHACCLAHARRKYVDAVKVNTNDQESARIVALMDELFAIDREAREQNLDHAQRDLVRQEQAPKLLEQLRAAALALKKTALPKSAAGQAANYTLSFWSKLTVFLKHPELALSTNLAENAMRSIAIGRNYAQFPIMRSVLGRGRWMAGPIEAVSIQGTQTSHNQWSPDVGISDATAGKRARCSPTSSGARSLSAQ